MDCFDCEWLMGNCCCVRAISGQAKISSCPPQSYGLQCRYGLLYTSRGGRYSIVVWVIHVCWIFAILTTSAVTSVVVVVMVCRLYTFEFILYDVLDDEIR